MSLSVCTQFVMAAVWFAGAALAQAVPTSASGIVVDEDGKPLAGVAVCGFNWADGFTTSELAKHPLTCTDAAGRFTLAPGDPPFERALFVADGRVHVSASMAHLGLMPVMLPKARTLAGVVRGPDGKPFPGARVEARDWLDIAPFLGSGERVRFASPWSAVRTDQQGRFVVNASCDTAMAVLIGGDGIEPLLLAPVAAGDPLDVTVERFDPVVASVLDEGKPVAGELVLWAADRSPPGREWFWLSRTDAEGRTRAPVSGVRHVICARQIPGQEEPHSDRVDVKPDARTIELHLTPEWARPTRNGDPVTIHVVDQAGAPVEKFRAAVAMAYSGAARAQQVANMLGACARTMAESRGSVVTMVPVLTGIERLCVLVDVPGAALAAHFVDRAAEVTVPLQTPGIVTGTVVDARTGAGLRGARVWALPRLNDDELEFYAEQGFAQLDPRLATAVTGADGAFRLDRLPAGELHVLCVVPDRPTVNPIMVRCEAGKAQSVRIEVAPMIAFTGKIDSKVTPSGLAIRFKPLRGRSSSVEAWDFSRGFPLAADGTFAASGIAPDTYDVQLLVDCGFRTGAPEKVATGFVTKIGVNTATLTVPVGKAMPGRLHGKVKTAVPPQRLAVISLGKLAGVFPDFDVDHPLALLGPTCPVRRDGSYDLLEPPGMRVRLVIDLLTGVILDLGNPAQVDAASTASVDSEFEAAMIDVLAGGPGLAAAGSCTLEVRGETRWVPHGFGALDKHNSPYYVARCRLERGQRQVSLYLPKGSFDLLLFPTSEEGRPEHAQLASEHLEVTSSSPRKLALELPTTR